MSERFKADDLVCDVVAAAPATWAVFERHGMCESCRSEPPRKALSHFANNHVDGDVERLLGELQVAAEAAANANG